MQASYRQDVEGICRRFLWTGNVEVSNEQTLLLMDQYSIRNVYKKMRGDMGKVEWIVTRM